MVHSDENRTVVSLVCPLATINSNVLNVSGIFWEKIPLSVPDPNL